MVLQYLHGIETIEVNDSIRPIRTVRSAIIGLIGTAPDADADIWPLNVPVLIAGNPRTGLTLGTTGTLPDALNSIFKQTNPIIVVVRVTEGTDVNATLSNFVGSAVSLTGVHAFKKAPALLGLTPKLMIAPGYTAQRPTDGVASVSMTAGGSHYTKQVRAVPTEGTGHGDTYVVTSSGGVLTACTPLTKGWGFVSTPPTIAFVDDGAVAASGAFTLATNATEGDHVVGGGRTYIITGTIGTTPDNVLLGDTAADTIANLVQAINAGSGSGSLYATGTTINANATAAIDLVNNQKLNATQKVAGYAGNSDATTTTSTNGSWGHATLLGGLGGAGATATAALGTVANPVVAELTTILDSLRGIAIVDSPSSSYANAVSYRDDYDSMRLWIVEGGFQEWSDENSEAVSVPAAPLLAGMQAKVDDENGFWFSASNFPLDGVIGVNRPIDFSLFSSNSEGQLLNEMGVAVTVGGNGYRVMGVRSPTSDTLWAFLPVRRTADMVYESIEYAIRDAVDKPISIGVIDWIEGSVRSYLRYLKSVGAIIDGNCWIDRTNNPVTELQNGHITFDIDLEPPAPMERISFRAHRQAGYYTEILDAVTRNAGV